MSEEKSLCYCNEWLDYIDSDSVKERVAQNRGLWVNTGYSRPESDMHYVMSAVNKPVYLVSKDKLKEEAAIIQQEADKDIAQNITKDTSIWYSHDVYNLLLVGYDAGEQETVMFEGMRYPRSDSIIIASVNKDVLNHLEKTFL